MNKHHIWMSLAFCGFLSTAEAQTALEKAHVEYKSGQYGSAIELYEQALTSSSDLDAMLNLATCYRYLGNWQKAEATYLKAAANPMFSTKERWVHLYFFADVLKSLGKVQDARKWLEKCKQFQPFIADKALASLAFCEKNKDALSAYKIKAETEVNTESSEFAATFFKSGVVFASTRSYRVEAFGGNSDPYTMNTLYLSERSTNGKLSKPKAFQPQSQLGHDQNLAPISFSQDGKRAIAMLNGFHEGYRHLRGAGISHPDMQANLSVHKVDPATNSTGEPEAFAQNAQNSVSGFPSLSPDGSTLYFSSDRIGDKGFDIYVSYYQNGAWTTPQSLGDNVNTLGDEIAPFIASDGTLYFSSDFHKGFGGYDIYSAKRNAQGVWGDVRHLGAPVNSSYDDLYFVLDDASSVGYFTSNRPGGSGDYDIYSCVRTAADPSLSFPVLDQEQNTVVVTPPSNTGGGNTNITTTDNGNPYAGTGGNTNTTTTNTNGGNPYAGTGGNNNPTTTTTTTTTTNTSDVPCGLNFYIGGVIDQITRKPLTDVAVFILNETTQIKEKVFTNRFGEYSVYLEPKTSYTIGLSKAGYQNTQFSVNTDIGGQKTLLGTRAIAPVSNTNTLFEEPQTVVTTNPVVQNQGTIQNSWDNPDRTQPTMPEYKYSLAPNKPVPAKGYYVQVGQFTKLEESKKDDLRRYGNLYTVPAGTRTTYRLGIYADYNHASDIAKELGKNGYTGAWVVPEDLKNSSVADKLNSAQMLYPVGVGESPIAGRGTQTTVISDKTQPALRIQETERNDWADNDGLKTTQTADDFKEFNTANAKGVEFKVQLGAYQHPEGITFANLSDLGRLEKEPRSTGLTHFYIAGFANVEEARRARALAEERGTPGPFVVAFKDGKRVDLKEVLK